MRLSDSEVTAITESFKEAFDTGTIYLFGSRIDDAQKGGDIDLYIQTHDTDKVKRKIDFLVKLKRAIGEQKIDVVLSYDRDSAIEKEAISHAMKLYEITPPLLQRS